MHNCTFVQIFNNTGFQVLGAQALCAHLLKVCTTWGKKHKSFCVICYFLHLWLSKAHQQMQCAHVQHIQKNEKHKKLEQKKLVKKFEKKKIGTDR